MEDRQTLMGDLELDHVGMVVRDIEKSILNLSSIWRIGPVRRLETDSPNALLHGRRSPLKAKLAFIQAGPTRLELMQPGEGRNIYWEFLETKGEGLHHLGFFVPDIEQELAKFKARGIEVLQGVETPSVKYAYMDTGAIAGVILEVLQRKAKPV